MFRPLYHSGKRPLSSLNRRLMGPQFFSGRFGKEEKFLTLSEVESYLLRTPALILFTTSGETS
jgi:hypothetical protein